MEEDGGKTEFLEQLVEYGMLDSKANGITQKVSKEGEGNLSPKQRFIFGRVIERFATAECMRCCQEISWSEMFEAHMNGGYCGRCVHYICDDLADMGMSWEDMYGDDTSVFLHDLYELYKITQSEREKKTPKREGFFN
jgi:hypothetical protein